MSVELRAAVAGLHLVFERLLDCQGLVAVNCDNLLFSALLERQTDVILIMQSMTKGTGHACRYGDSSYYGRWYGSLVHQFEG